MPFPVSVKARVTAIPAAAVLCVLALAGCDEHIQVTKDPDVRITSNMTWAWRPMPPRDNRRVLSRDVIGRERNERATQDRNADNEIVRQRVKSSIEQVLKSKGLREIDDPAGADFLVDYHFAVQRRSEQVQTVYPGGYPGLVCGPFGCWEGWDWGAYGVGYENIHFREGTIVFDLLQNGTNHLVYRAVGEKRVHHDTFSLTQGDINDLVHRLLYQLRVRK